MNLRKTQALIVAVAMAALAACGGTEEAQWDCRVDADCTAGYHCGPDLICLCVSDASCAEDEYCNVKGYCQKLEGCRTDSECGDESLWGCMISGEEKVGRCLCKSDLACESDEFCNTAGACQKRAGCTIDEDCGGGDWSCVIDPATQIGQCLCRTDNACEPDEFCNVHGYCQPVDVCQTDDDCPTGQFCNTDTGECRCDYETQTGCGDKEICNNSGYCQPRPGCYNNADCEHLVDHYCDITTQTCVPAGTCNSDRQCPLGQLCRQNVCVDGCNNGNDCPLDQCCNNLQCEPCDCQGDEFCDFMHLCMDGQCQNPYSQQTPYCKPCDNPTAECGADLNRCIIYPYKDDAFAAVADEYCAVDCSNDQQCPNGFNCGPIRLVDPADECLRDADCPENAPCLTNPEDDIWHCACHDTTNPCPFDSCFLGKCVYRKTPCDTSADCTIRCEELSAGSGAFGCVIARSCGLKEGFRCPPP
jgi:hypothetical protein